MIIAKFLHMLGFTIWVGGMFFAHNALRPVVATKLEPPQRLSVLAGVFSKFFVWVWISIALVLGSGLYMMMLIGKPPAYVTLMFMLGVIMMLLFGHIFFALYRRLTRAVAAQDWPAGGAAAASIRKLVALNLVLGLVTIAVGALGNLTL